ncbi:MAG: hypothetical protein K8S62_04500 [Candidatus Sabulitectum sp.]|nr:hypothetical protein [Candidatus Sabulitectum sp.]
MRNKAADGIALTGFVVIGILVAVGVFTDTVYLIAGGLAAALLAGMFLAYPLRLAAMLFGVQIVFTTALLGGFSVYAGPFRIGIDDLLQLLVFFLWIGAFIDGEGRVSSTSSGRLILVLVTMSVLAFFRGIMKGFEVETAAIFLKPMMGYLFFFPAMWILKDSKNMKVLVATFLIASLIAAGWIILKGFIGGEGVYHRVTSGLRVSSREVNVVVAGLLLTAMLLWKRYRSIPLLPGIAAVLIMGAAILLGQSRALWLAVASGILISFIADMSRTGAGGFRFGSFFSRVLLMIVFIGGSIAFVAAAGLLSAGDVAARSGGADGGLAGDVSLWARFLSWWEILVTVTASPLTFIFGTGFGFRITYFRPDLLARVSIPFIDGSFFQLLLNLGISGSVALALLFAGGIAGSFRYATKAVSDRDTVLALWLTASFTALTIAALSGSLITNYRFTCLWAFMFAVLETIRSKSGKNS